MREHFVVPSIRSRDVACTQGPYIRSFEHFLKLFDIANNAFNVHSASISTTTGGEVKRKPHAIVRQGSYSVAMRF